MSLPVAAHVGRFLTAAPLLAALAACGPPRYRLSEAAQCRDGQVVTVVNPTNLDVDVRYGNQYVGTVPSNTTETLTLPPNVKNGYVRTIVLPPTGAQNIVGSVHDARASIRTRVHCTGT